MVNINNFPEIDVLKSALEGSRDGIICIDNTGSMIYLNSAAEKNFGFIEEEIKGKKIFEVLVSDMYIEDFKGLFNEDKSHNDSLLYNTNIEIFAKKRKGELFPVEIKISPINDKFLCCYIRDVTERINAEEEITRLVQELEVSKSLLEQYSTDLLSLENETAQIFDQVKISELWNWKYITILNERLKKPIKELIKSAEVIQSDDNKLSEEELSIVSTRFAESIMTLREKSANLFDWMELKSGEISFHPEGLNIFELIEFEVRKIRKIHGKNIFNSIDKSTSVFSDNNITHTVIKCIIENLAEYSDHFYFNSSVSGDNVIIYLSPTINFTSSDSYKELSPKEVFSLTMKGNSLGLALATEFMTINNGSLDIFMDSIGRIAYMLIFPSGK